jgi:hypothetical protein
VKERVEILGYEKVAGVNCKTVSKFETQRSSEGCTKEIETSIVIRCIVETRESVTTLRESDSIFTFN